MYDREISELYESRMLLNVLFFNNLMGCDCHKSLKWQPKKGSTKWIEEKGWFVVMAELAEGQISFHYKIEYWDLFNIPIKEQCNLFDGHDTDMVNSRILDFIKNEETQDYLDRMAATFKGELYGKEEKKNWWTFIKNLWKGENGKKVSVKWPL